MRKEIGLALCAVLLLCATARAQDPVKETREIRAVAAQWQNDWNHHNASALAGLLTEDADYVTYQAFWLRGRTQFERWFGAIESQKPSPREWINDEVTLRFLQPEIAIVHVAWRWRSTSAGKGGGSPWRSGTSTWLLVKLGDGWKIRAAQDTSSP